VVEHCLTISVRDSAAMLDALQGPDAGAPYYAAPPARPYLEEVASPPGHLRIAFSDAPLLGHDVHPDCRAALQDAVRLLESLGHDVVEATPRIDRESFNRAFLAVICGELRAELDEAAALVGHEVTPADVEVATWGLAMIGRALTAADFAGATHVLRMTARGVGAFFEGFDVLVTPTLAMPPVRIGSLQPPARELALLRLLGRVRGGRLLQWLGALERTAEKVFDFIPYTPLFNVTGQPAMSVPLHWNAEGLPIGVHFVGRYGDEATLFRLAGQLEAARPWKNRRPPDPARSPNAA
jgi:amidase